MNIRGYQPDPDKCPSEPPEPPKGGSGASNCRPVMEWSTDLPAGPGWYWLEPVPMFHKTLCKIRNAETEGILGTLFYLSIELFGHPKERPLEFFIQDYPNAKWLKIDEPE